MKLLLTALLGSSLLGSPTFAQTPAPTPLATPPVGTKQADPLNPQKAEQEPRPVAQELQKQATQSRDAVAGQPVVAVTDAADAADVKAPKWDVNVPRGPGRDARIDTRSGTWMSVDVSPDGREVAFDLLGDLYIMPIGRRRRPDDRYTVANGRVYDSDMNEVGSRKKARAAFWFEGAAGAAYTAAVTKSVGHVD